ncbi:kinase-like domain-containing protein [Annulohypoxylon stygium]|nr:kinase-like domain-containing protein [Annulohypoxylon stygium]
MSVHNFYSDEGEELVSERIKSYFDAAPLFKWGGQLGSGANGIVYKVFNQVDGKLRTFAVKIAPIDVDLGGNKSWGEDDEPVPDEVQSLESEKLWLSRLRNCPHIIKSIDLPYDPLSQSFENIIPHRMRSWIFMEYAENGSLQTFVDRHLERYNGEVMPNRLLWRLFMCLIRGCLDMAYYNAQLDGRPVDLNTVNFNALSSIEPGDLAHRDLGSHNIVLGPTEIDQTPEHYLTPILKIIDFGEAYLIDPETDRYGRTGSQRNVRDICRIMVYILLHDLKFFKEITITIWGETFKTEGSAVYERHNEFLQEGVDEELLYLLYKGTSPDKDVTPDLVELARYVHERIMIRDDRGEERETDKAIKERVFSLIYDADTRPRKRGRDDDEMDIDMDTDMNEGETKRRRLDDDGDEVLT